MASDFELKLAAVLRRQIAGFESLRLCRATVRRRKPGDEPAGDSRCDGGAQPRDAAFARRSGEHSNAGISRLPTQWC